MNKKAILPILFFSIYIGICIPTTLFYGNINEFVIDFSEVLGLLVIVTAACLIALMLLLLVISYFDKDKETLTEYYTSLVFGAGVGAYIQFNFLNSSLSILNGEDMTLADMRPEVIISSIIWICCIAVPLLMTYINKTRKAFSQIKAYASGFFTAVQLLSVLILALTTKSTVDDFVLTKTDEFGLSGKKNTVVFIVDTLDAQWAESYIINDENNHIFDDFVYYSDVVSCGAPTELGIPMLLTGEFYDPYDMDKEDYYRYAYGRSQLFGDLKKKGYGVHLYTNKVYIDHADYDNIDNVIRGMSYRISGRKAFIRKMYKLTAFVAAPMLMKPPFLIYTDDLTQLIESESKEVSVYTMDDPLFYQDFLQNGIELHDSEGEFVLYHLQGVHGPYNMDQNCIDVGNNGSTFEEQLSGVCRIIAEYMDKMKSLGVYDTSTIIITGDHGGVDLYQNPAVFVKYPDSYIPERAGSEHMDDSPKTFVNLRATIAASLLGDASGYGETLEDAVSDPDIKRRHSFTYVLKDKRWPDIDYGFPFYMAEVGIPGRDMEQVELIHGKRPYRPGDVLWFSEADHEYDVDISGFHDMEDDHRWTSGDTATVSIPLVEDISANSELIIDCEPSDVQSMTVYADNRKIGEFSAGKRTVQIMKIPQKLKAGGELVLRFEMPGASSEDGNEAFSFNSLQILDRDHSYDYEIGKEIGFGLDVPEYMDGTDYAIKGLSGKEDGFVWSEGNEVIFRFRLHDVRKDLSLKMNYATFHGIQPVLIYVNNDYVGRFDTESAEGSDNELIIPKDSFIEGVNQISFILPEACSPESLGYSGDSRILAIAFSSMVLDYN